MTNPFTVEWDGTLRYKNGAKCGSVYQEIDGYYVWSPPATGSIYAGQLMQIVSLLNEMNAEWDAQVRKSQTDDRCRYCTDGRHYCVDLA